MGMLKYVADKLYSNDKEVALAENLPVDAIGVNQTWQNKFSERALGTTYTNTTDQPIQVNVTLSNTGGTTAAFYVDGLMIARAATITTSGYLSSINGIIVPTGSTYILVDHASITLSNWFELRGA